MTISYTGTIGSARLERTDRNAVLVVSTAVQYRMDQPTIWIQTKIWGQRGISLEQHMKTGETVYAAGRLEVRSWEREDKTTSFELVCNASEFEFLGARVKRAPVESTNAEN